MTDHSPAPSGVVNATIPGHSEDLEHVMNCPDCQARAGLGLREVNLDRAWTNIAAVVWSRRVSPWERWLGQALRSPGLARALLATPSLVISWILASVAVLGLGVLAAWSSAHGTPWFALIAPAVAAAAIAHAYGPGVDPAFELSRTMVVSDRLVLLARGVAVFGLNALLSVVASIVAPAAGVAAWGWLVPMAAVATLALAVAVWTQSANSGVAVASAVWFVLVVTLSDLGRDRVIDANLDAAIQPGLMPLYLTMTAICLLAVFFGTESKLMEGRRWRKRWIRLR